MSLDVVLPLLTTITSAVFAAMVFGQFRRRRKPYQLLWTIGLLWYALSAGTEFVGNAIGWSIDLYRLWYISGAFFVAAYLGMGSVYLLAPRRPAHAVMAVLAVASVVAALRVFSAPVEASLLPAAGEVVSGRALPGDVRVFTPFFNIFGAGALILGAGYSAYVFWRKGIMRHRVTSNILVAVGAFVPSITGGLSRFGITQTFFLGELLGVVLIFVGFLVSVEVFEQLPFGRRQPGVASGGQAPGGG